MSAGPRRKACIGCAESKRRCDKQLPECQRCLDRDEDCVYPQPRRRRRTRPGEPSDTRIVERAPLQDLQAGTLETSYDFGGWESMDGIDFSMALSDVTLPMLPISPTPLAISSNQASMIGNVINVTDALRPWFLGEDTWAMRHSSDKSECLSMTEFDSFTQAVQSMLQAWIRDGYNSFIHRRLYREGMPSCLQDAFTTLAAYTNRTPAVRETILQIADDRASALVRQNSCTTGSAQSVLERLARIQALFVYEFIRLFDGSVRWRASAEQQIPTLARWMLELMGTIRRYGEDQASGIGPSTFNASEFEREYAAASHMWQLWILTESVRRTQFVIAITTGVYQTMTRGWSECSGTVMITARRGLWEAESAVKWLDMSRVKGPLLVPSMEPTPSISLYAAEEIDDFAKMIWTFLLGPDKFQSWIDRGSKAIDRENVASVGIHVAC